MSRFNPLQLRSAWVVGALAVGAGAGFALGWASRSSGDSTNASPASAVISETPVPVASAPPGPATPTPEARVAPQPSPAGDPRVAEYAKLGFLKAGMYVGQFERALGVPLFVRKSKDGTRLEKTFSGPDYFVQTIEDADGTVHLMAVTSCSEDFQPKFVTPVGPVTLSKTTMKEVGTPSDHTYSVGGTSNTLLYDLYYLGNPGNYKMYITGVNDACNYRVNFDVVRKYGGGQKIPGQVSDPDPDALREKSIVNTYAETAPGGFALEMAVGKDPPMQVGVNRILIRTLAPR